MATSATFDAQAILDAVDAVDAVDAGKAPDHWEVYRTNGDYFWRTVLIAIASALLCSFMVLAIVVMVNGLSDKIGIRWNDSSIYPFVILGILLLIHSLRLLERWDQPAGTATISEGANVGAHPAWSGWAHRQVGECSILVSSNRGAIVGMGWGA